MRRPFALLLPVLVLGVFARALAPEPVAAPPGIWAGKPDFLSDGEGLAGLAPGMEACPAVAPSVP